MINLSAPQDDDKALPRMEIMKKEHEFIITGWLIKSSKLLTVHAQISSKKCEKIHFFQNPQIIKRFMTKNSLLWTFHPFWFLSIIKTALHACFVHAKKNYFECYFLLLRVNIYTVAVCYIHNFFFLFFFFFFLILIKLNLLY